MIPIEDQPDDSLVSKRLRAAFDRAGKTTKVVAEEVGCTAHALRYWLRGERVPRPKYWAPLARALRVSVAYFVRA